MKYMLEKYKEHPLKCKYIDSIFLCTTTIIRAIYIHIHIHTHTHTHTHTHIYIYIEGNKDVSSKT